MENCSMGRITGLAFWPSWAQWLLYSRVRRCGESPVPESCWGWPPSLPRRVAAFALLGICIFLLWDGRRNREPWPQLLRTQVLIVLSFLGALFLLCLPYIATTGIAKLWYFQITYVRTHYVTGLDASMGLPELPSWRRLPFVAQYLLIYLLLPLVYADR